MTPVIHEEGYLRLRRIEIINRDGKSLNIQNLFRGIDIVESIGSIWVYGNMKLEEQFNYRETLPFVGKEKLHVVWDSGDGSEQRDYTFIITAIDVITEKKQNEIFVYNIEFVHEDFENFLQEKPYQKSFDNQTNGDMLEDIFFNYGVFTENKVVNDTVTYSYIANSYDIVETIEEIEYLSDDPKMVFQKHNDTVIYDIETLFAQPNSKLLTNASMVVQAYGDRRAIQSIEKIEPMMRRDFYDDGVNGYIHYDVDLFDEKYDLKDVSLDVEKKKFDYDSEKKNTRTLKSSKYLEDYMMMDAVQARMKIPSTDLKIGDLITLKYFLNQNNQQETSKYSGDWLLNEIVHRIDVNFVYSQLIVLVRKDLNRSLF